LGIPKYIQSPFAKADGDFFGGIAGLRTNIYFLPFPFSFGEGEGDEVKKEIGKIFPLTNKSSPFATADGDFFKYFY